MCLPPQHLEWQELASDYKPNSYLLARYVPGMPGISCIKAALALYVFLRKPQKATIYNSGLPQDSRHFYKMPRDLPLRQSSGAWAATSVQ